ncbi:MAG: rRNA pseudouridine synthase [Candidatus Omnitrophica bacterium]|nr:rRNA pseudouridine synthase [Candidatus Omnitrophota bacterium]
MKSAVEEKKTYRLNQYLARCGVASRRKAEELILGGEVTVNGKLADHPGIQVTPYEDTVRLRGKLVALTPDITLIMHKPKGVLCSRDDGTGRKTVFDLLPKKYVQAGVQSIGRLDFDSSGLMILTNRGELHQRMEHPSGRVFRVYQVKARGIMNHERKEGLLKGVRLREGIAKAERIEVEKISSDISRFKLTLAEGKNREVRRMCEQVGIEVLDLKRIQYGQIFLGPLPSGKFREPFMEEKSFFEKILRKPKKNSSRSPKPKRGVQKR